MFSFTGVDVALSGSVSGKAVPVRELLDIDRCERQQRVKMLPVGARALRRQRGRGDCEPEARPVGCGQDRRDERHQEPIERHLGSVGGTEVLEEAALELTFDESGKVFGSAPTPSFCWWANRTKTERR